MLWQVREAICVMGAEVRRGPFAGGNSQSCLFLYSTGLFLGALHPLDADSSAHFQGRNCQNVDLTRCKEYQKMTTQAERPVQETSPVLIQCF